MTLALTLRKLFGLQTPPRSAAISAGAAGDAVAPVDMVDTVDRRLNVEARHAMDLMERGANVFVTGGAGTGKTTLVRRLLSKSQRRSVVLAPTGIAALNAGGETIHSFFRFPARPIDPSTIRPLADRRLVQKLETMIIDEVSMVRADLLDAVDRSLRVTRGKPTTAFGGVQLILVGDPFQLPPVVASQEEAKLFTRRYRSPFFFDSEAWHAGQFSTALLTQPFRQSDPAFLRILDAVRLGRRDLVDLTKLDERIVDTSAPIPTAITLTPTNARADAINEDAVRALRSPMRSYKAILSGTFQAGRERTPSPTTLNLCVGARVMFTKNDGQKRWVNGTLGTVSGLGDTNVSVRLDAGDFAMVERVKWETCRYRFDDRLNRVVTETIGSFEQLPLTSGWAVTIHKSQGLTLDQVIVDLDRGAFASGQLYVALSRCRSLAGLRLAQPVQPADVICNDRVVEFFRETLGKADRGTILDDFITTHGFSGPPLPPVQGAIVRET